MAAGAAGVGEPWPTGCHICGDGFEEREYDGRNER